MNGKQNNTNEAKENEMDTAQQRQEMDQTLRTTVEAFLVEWHENGRLFFERSYPNSNYNAAENKWFETRRKYVCLNAGSSSVMMLEIATGQVYGIKGYGRIHRGRPIGDIRDLTDRYREQTEKNRLVDLTRRVA